MLRTSLWFILILTTLSATAEQCAPFDCYQEALDQLKYARELIETQHAENKKLLTEIKQLTETNNKLISQNQKIISSLQQKTEIINKETSNELSVKGIISADTFKSGIKSFSPYNTVEPDSADKDFYADKTCVFGTITSALINNKNGSNLQAAICTCLKSKRGRGWFCLN